MKFCRWPRSPPRFYEILPPENPDPACRYDGGVRALVCRTRGSLPTHYRNSGSRLTLTPFSVTDTIAPRARSSLQISKTLTSRRARSSARCPSIRTRMTEGLDAPDSASRTWKSASKVTTVQEPDPQSPGFSRHSLSRALFLPHGPTRSQLSEGVKL